MKAKKNKSKIKIIEFDSYANDYNIDWIFKDIEDVKKYWGKFGYILLSQEFSIDGNDWYKRNEDDIQDLVNISGGDIIIHLKFLKK